MKSFTIFMSQYDDYRAIKNGWSWPAFAFGIIWTLVEKLWAISILLAIYGLIVGITVVYYFIEDILANPSLYSDPMFFTFYTTPHIIGTLFGLALALVLGLYGNALLRRRLYRQGYVEVASITAENADIAVAHYLKNKGSNQSQHSIPI